MVILYDKGMTTVIPRHLVTASLYFRGLCGFFFLSGTHCISPTDQRKTRTRDTERSMINATTRERRFERHLQTRFDYWY